MRPNIFEEMVARGLVADCSDAAALAVRLAAGPITAYCGFDPTADSLHVGSLQSMMVLLLFQRYGHQSILLIGGATGFIGDPSGKRSDRQLLDADVLDQNRAGLRAQMERLLPALDGKAAPIIVDNRDWIGPMTVIEFLRDVGCHFRVNSMIAKDSVKMRFDSGNGISYTEFSYSLLQARDFEHLHRTYDCELQLGGTDQWGNVTAGLELMRRRGTGSGHALVWPLLLKEDGEKFGKSVDGNVWLDPKRTSVYRFYQFWRNVDDALVEALLKRFTFIELDEIAQLMVEHRLKPELRLAQQRLAEDVTRWVHGDDATRSVIAASRAVFGDRRAVLTAAEVDILEAEIPMVKMAKDAIVRSDLPSLLVQLGLAESKSDARRAITASTVSVNGEPVPQTSSMSDLLGALPWALLRRGRRNVGLVRIADANQAASAAQPGSTAGLEA